ncbi:MAG TPA: hypothetical protein VHJ78_07220 [Actinomycetota bacterium]|nr:hypothetical protein [Actinomycetota bacterium]
MLSTIARNRRSAGDLCGHISLIGRRDGRTGCPGSPVISRAIPTLLSPRMFNLLAAGGFDGLLLRLETNRCGSVGDSLTTVGRSGYSTSRSTGLQARAHGLVDGVLLLLSRGRSFGRGAGRHRTIGPQRRRGGTGWARGRALLGGRVPRRLRLSGW